VALERLSRFGAAVHLVGVRIEAADVAEGAVEPLKLVPNLLVRPPLDVLNPTRSRPIRLRIKLRVSGEER
jgi:hypothetical protein